MFLRNHKKLAVVKSLRMRGCSDSIFYLSNSKVNRWQKILVVVINFKIYVKVNLG